MVIFVALILFMLLEQQKKLKCHEKICKNKDICRIAMPSWTKAKY